MSSRRKARELALQLLFQQDLSGLSPAEILDVFWKANPVNPGNREFAEFLFKRSLENRSQIDNLIRGHTEHWRLERMAVVDRNILRMAVSEFLYAETPKIVVIDEAIEIARKFSTEESTQFVNGVLDAIRKKVEYRAIKEGHHAD